jgi:molecular chaperone DnaK (HSP70)
MSKRKAYGIDFGTTNSTIAVVDDSSQIQQLPVDAFSDNKSVMRSVIFVDKNNQCQVPKTWRWFSETSFA